MPEQVNRTRFSTGRPLLVGWPLRLGVSFAMGGFLAAMAVISFPLPWTPVPFSLMPMALLVAGVVQRPAWGGLSVALYLTAAGLGAPIFAEGESGWHHFFGSTGGYLLGFAVVPPLVAGYLRTPRGRARSGLLAATATGFFVAIAAGIAMSVSRQGFTDAGGAAGWGWDRSLMWVLLFIIAAATAGTMWWLRVQRGRHPRILEAWLAFMGAIFVVHALGVAALWALTDLALLDAVLLGSLVFIPFDIVKAGVAVAAALPFLPPSTEAA